MAKDSSISKRTPTKTAAKRRGSKVSAKTVARVGYKRSALVEQVLSTNQGSLGFVVPRLTADAALELLKNSISWRNAHSKEVA